MAVIEDDAAVDNYFAIVNTLIQEDHNLADACLYLNKIEEYYCRTGQYYTAMLLRERITQLTAQALTTAKEISISEEIAKRRRYIDTHTLEAEIAKRRC